MYIKSLNSAPVIPSSFFPVKLNAIEHVSCSIPRFGCQQNVTCNLQLHMNGGFSFVTVTQEAIVLCW